MKRLVAVIAILGSSAALAEPVQVGRLVSSGAAINNSTTAAPFAITPGNRYGVQCSKAVYRLTGNAASVAATSAYKRLGELQYWEYDADTKYLSILPVDGVATTCTVDLIKGVKSGQTPQLSSLGGTSNSAFFTQGPVEYCVSASTGSDNNSCTCAAPCATIQRAVNAVPKGLLTKTIITIDGGAYTGAYVENFYSGVGSTSPTDGGWLLIRGVFGEAHLDGGLTTGVISASSAGSGVTFGTFTVADAGWIPGDLRHKQVFIAGNKRQIEDNTATVATISGTWTAPSVGATFEMKETTVEINTAIAFPASAFGGATANFAGMILANDEAITGSGMIGIEGIHFKGTGRGISFYSAGGATINNCRFTTTTAGIELGRSGGNITISDNDFQGSGVFFSQSTVGQRRLTFRRNISDGASACFQSDQCHATLTGNSCRNSTLHHMRFGMGIDCDINGDHYETAVGACVTSNMLSNGMGNGNLIVRNSYFRGCLGGGLFLLGPVFVEATTVVIGNNLGSAGVTNSAGITLQDGARIRVGTNTYLDGGSTVPDINVDATTYQWAGFRAIGPPINVTNTTTGSRIWNP